LPCSSVAAGLNNHVKAMTAMTEIRQFFQHQRSIVCTSPGNFHHEQKNDSREMPTACGFQPIKEQKSRNSSIISDDKNPISFLA